MQISLIALIAFAVAALGVAAVLLLVRDLFFVRRASTASPKLRRLVPVPVLTGDGPVHSLDRALENLAVESGWEISATGVVLLLVACGLLLGGPLFAWNDNLLLAVVAAILGMGLAIVCLLLAARRRQRLLREQLPGALDMLARAVRAGQSLDQAVTMVGDKSPSPLGKEFRRCAQQLSLGLSLASAMRGLASRVRLIEMQIFAATLRVHRHTGGNLAGTLERLARVVRDRLSYRRQMAAVTGAGRFSAMLISIAGPALFAYMFLMQHDYMHSLIDTPLGQTLLGLAVALEIIGLIWVSRLVRADD